MHYAKTEFFLYFFGKMLKIKKKIKRASTSEYMFFASASKARNSGLL